LLTAKIDGQQKNISYLAKISEKVCNFDFATASISISLKRGFINAVLLGGRKTFAFFAFFGHFRESFFHHKNGKIVNLKVRDLFPFFNFD